MAEGLEAEPQLQALRALGCRVFQGYLFSRPVPAAEFTGLLRGDGTKGAPPAAARAQEPAGTC